MTDTSQFGEGQRIVDHFAGRVGRFLDVGAFDGVTFSNTKMLADMGWSGVCVEPSPPAFCHLMKTYRDNPRVQLVNAAVVPNSQARAGVRRFLCNTPDGNAADALSTFEQRHADKFAVGNPFREIFIPFIAWIDIKYHVRQVAEWTDFDFVNLDVEGLNAAVLRDMPFRPELICVEYDPDADGEAAKEILTGWGYKWELIGGNLLGVRG